MSLSCRKLRVSTADTSSMCYYRISVKAVSIIRFIIMRVRMSIAIESMCDFLECNTGLV